MTNQEQPAKPERQFIENFFVDEKFFSDTDEYLLDLLEDRYEVESATEVEDSFVETFEFSELKSPLTLTPEMIVENCLDEDLLSENDEGKYFKKVVEILKKHIDFDKINAKMPKLYYPTGETMRITKADLIEWDN